MCIRDSTHLDCSVIFDTILFTGKPLEGNLDTTCNARLCEIMPLYAIWWYDWFTSRTPDTQECLIILTNTPVVENTNRGLVWAHMHKNHTRTERSWHWVQATTSVPDTYTYPACTPFYYHNFGPGKQKPPNATPPTVTKTWSLGLKDILKYIKYASTKGQ